MNGFEVAQWVIRIAFALAFIGMGLNHFRRGPAKVMAKMVPPALRGTGALSPARLVLYTGICEVAGGVGLVVPAALIPGVQYAAAIALIVFLIAVFPANAYAAAHPETFRSLAIPFWPRFLAQVVMIGLLGVTLAA
ncbi:DoxX family protein [Naasia lichenicola]|uniref:DoxX family membrane protein n=1 Tax=Naasia lichenicola TaxID=2565933 RepID=A0A4S4FN07_9MICO|nr:DoxX family protein [Naasia lichenicola]THG31819.1 hypothetical protein E6C64_07150 [Naasia lichenicola]